jgi:4-amino-4-deoxy-L-arabinose transferase-like glycosyltransferase
MTPTDRTHAGPEWRWAIGIIALMTAIQLAAGAGTPLDGDETYYWEWSRHLAPGYFDHPPAIAYLVWAGRWIFGDTPLGVRLLSILCNAGGMALMVLLALRCGGERAALRTALAVVTVPIISVWLLLATPDPALFLAHAASVYGLVRAIEAPPRSRASLHWWVIAGLALGASLLAKEMAILLPLGVLLAFVTHPALRRRLGEPGPWLACGIALVLFAPVVIWNSGNDWPFAFQLNHGLGAPKGSAFERELNLLLSQVGVGGGILFVLMVIATADGLRRRRTEPIPYLFAVITVVSFSLFVLSALRRRVEANWPAPAYTTAVLLLALSARGGSWHRWLKAGYALGAVVVILAYAHMLAPVFRRTSGGDLVRRGHGWSLIAERIGAVRMNQPEGTTTWLAGNTYQDASELAFHLPDHPRVFSLNLASRTNQYVLWPQFSAEAKPGDDVIFIRSFTGVIPEAVHLLAPHFETVDLVDRVEPSAAYPEIPSRGIWVMRKWLGTWPDTDGRLTARPQIGSN